MTDDVGRLRDQVRRLTERVSALETKRYLPMRMTAYSTAERPTARAFPVGSPIWNTTREAPEWSDGVVWRDAQGNQT